MHTLHKQIKSVRICIPVRKCLHRVVVAIITIVTIYFFFFFKFLNDALAYDYLLVFTIYIYE